VRFVPRLLSDDQKAHRVSVCKELEQQARDDPNFMSNIITGDETWVYGYDPETKRQLSRLKSLNSPWPKKARQVRSNVDHSILILSGRNQFHPDPACKLSANLYDIYHSCVCSEKILMMDRGTV